jgi:hypothetical protein
MVRESVQQELQRMLRQRDYAYQALELLEQRIAQALQGEAAISLSQAVEWADRIGTVLAESGILFAISTEGKILRERMRVLYCRIESLPNQC